MWSIQSNHILKRNRDDNYKNNVQKFSSFDSPSAITPSYALFRSDIVFTLKFLSPTFKKTIKNNITIDRKGKLQFAFSPRVDGSSVINWPATKNVIIGVEDVGTALYNANNGINTVFQFTSNDENLTLKISSSSDDGDTTTTVSLEADGGIDDDIYREIVLNEGEFEVIKTFLADSIPRMVAWDSFLNLSIQNMYETGSNRYGIPDDPYVS